MTDEWKGKCKCGCIEFELNGAPMMNVLCHCKNCTTGLGCGCSIHLYLAATSDNWSITKGEEHVKMFEGGGALRFWRCTECGSPVMQGPEGAPFRAFYPRTFEGYVDGKCNKIPDSLKPKMHINYENRAWDVNDDLPKYAAFPPNNMVNNNGSPCETKEE
mmetsp:Transcript_11404/g.32851  ORF Transcript_11404/g.32851 Transcript_11404/m.32851 type:complete len:160 (+) Transcript_11404:146-625(+)|eukprot:CAMPEP_0172370966 /NCGR_PEP_ID=MMETSP1060-20121228/40617_1 /TAXON_ID=37318 /ORGANISM="Pseudo-nitzschia pungens, Strain cf. cingulata" /LENGTH=159 /DNA_ID=CAMNT_0013096439 /DNA_START=93 /DNA_END=572 /DNA_ORIENTATION=-